MYIARSLRLLKLLKEVRQWNIIIHTINALFSPFYILLLVTFMLFFVFSLIGDIVFGGKASTGANEIFRDQSIPDIYVEMNFNDLGSSFVTLFVMMVVNNWYIIVKMYNNISGHSYARLYFIMFYFCSVVVMLNIVVAFVIDMYSSVASLHAEEKEKAKST